MKIRNPRLIRALAHLLAGIFRAWLWFVRLRVVLETPGIDPCAETGDNRFLICLWHDAIVGILFSRPHRRMAGLVSLHADGGWVADAMEVIGVRPIRGSSGRRGAGAIREMMSAARDWHIAITTDGPRGPRRQVKDGILYLASHSGRTIIPVAYSGSRAWRPRGRWTDMLVPWPGARSAIIALEPIAIPPGLTPAELTPYRELLQREMDAAQAFGDALVRDELTGFSPGWRTRLGFPERPAELIARRAA